jgi:FixJ family two-component response regulator
VVILSGDGHVREKTAEIGAADYVQKPIELGSLLEIVRSFCGPPRGAERDRPYAHE